MQARRRLIIGGALITVGAAALGIWLGTDHSSAPARSVHNASASPTTATSAGTTGSAAGATKQASTTSPTTANGVQTVGEGVIPAETLVATIPSAGAPGSPTPGALPTMTIPGQWLRAASILPVIAQQSGWDEVRLAQRPNESVAWVPAADVRLASDSYHLVVNLATMHLQLFDHGQQVADFPAGIGVPSDPTPTGHFFVALFARAPSPGYGPFVLVTSAHSNTISDWEESGDAITAIHGPLGADAAIGTTGAEVSHGCIRLHDADLAQLRDVPAGTPVDILG
jgi:hypothetical protein